MTLVDNYFPFDAGAGQAATMTRWRSMGRLFCGSGVVPNYANQFACTISAGVVTVQPGAVWVDGFYGEVTANKTLSASGAGMVVAQMDPVNKYIRVVFQAGATYTPAQSLTGTFEVPLYTVSAAGALTDVRQFALADPNKVAKLRMYRTANYNTPTASTTLTFDSPTPYPPGWSGTLYTCPYAADYLVISQTGCYSTGANQWANASLIHNGGQVVWGGSFTSTAAGQALSAKVEDIVTCKAGDTLGVQVAYALVIANGGMTGSSRSYLSIRAMS